VAVEPESMSLMFWAGSEIVSQVWRVQHKADYVSSSSLIPRRPLGLLQSWKLLSLTRLHKGPFSLPGQRPGFSI
jgi:hypothetical protein